MWNKFILKLKKNKFLFEELVKRDFKSKYKRTVLGMVWSMLSPLLTLLVMSLVFTKFFGKTIPHYIIYLFAGNIVFNYFKEATKVGMSAFMSNANIITKINLPKYIFVFSKAVSATINFLLTIFIFFIFVAIDGINFNLKFIMLIYPVICLVIFNIGISLTLAVWFVFFRDIQYLYDIFTLLLMYLSAIFYSIEAYSLEIQYLFYLNPVYVYIRYFRKIVIENTIPSLEFHLLMAAYVVIVFGLGCWIYKKYNAEFLYYV